MKVVLAAINAKYIHSNLAVYSLKAYADHKFRGQHAPEIALAEYTINQQTEDILFDLYERQADVLCFSCYIWNITYVEDVARELHKLCPQMQIWAGGPEVSYDSRAFLERNPAFAGVMKGEGEETIAEVLGALCEQGSVDALSGITFRRGDVIIENEWRPVIDLSTVPFVYRDMADFSHKIIYYESSRGCPFHCSYCLSSVDKCLRFRKLELVLPELQFFLDERVPQVKFVDRTFNCRHDHALAIWTYISEHDNGVTNFHFEVSADLLNEEEIELIAGMRPGLIQLEIGVQSTNPQTIREIRRTMNLEKLKDRVERVKSVGNVHQHLDLIAGLPYEDYESFANSFNDVYEMKPDQLQMGFLKVLKGSHMESMKEAYGLVCRSKPPYEVLFTKWLPAEDVIRLKFIEEMVETYYNSGQFAVTISALAELFETPFACFEKLAEFYKMKQLKGLGQARSARYEFLLEFTEIHFPEKKEFVRQLLTFDYYLRENAKSRPDFCGGERTDKERVKEFYDREEGLIKDLPGYEAYDRRSLRKMTHIEAFDYLVAGDLSEGKCTVLFDYSNRNPIDSSARIVFPECFNLQNS